MGNVSLWTYSVILLCLSGITFSQRFPYENPSNGYRNAPSKLNLRNFLGGKLIQRLSDSENNPPQYESYPHQMSNPLPCEHPPPPPTPSLPPPPLPPSYSRGVVPFEYQNQRMPPPPSPPPQIMGTPRHLMSPPSTHGMEPPPPHAMEQPPHLMGPPTQHVTQSNMQENVYTETITSSCPECEAANQDYPYQEEPCSCCEGGCPCSCEDCPCCCKGRGRCPCYSDEPPYPPEKDYPERDHSYDDYPASDCPCCCCDCAGNHECPCSCSDEPQGPPQYRRERPSSRGYPPVKQVNENYMEGPDSQVQRESFHGMGGPSSYKPIPPPREVHQRRYPQYDEPMEPPQYVKMPPRRGFVSQPDMPPPPNYQAPAPELPPEPMHRHHMPEPVEPMHRHHMPEPVEPMHRHHMPEPVEPMHRHHMPEPIEHMHRHHMPEPIEPMHSHHMPEPVEPMHRHHMQEALEPMHHHNMPEPLEPMHQHHMPEPVEPMHRHRIPEPERIMPDRPRQRFHDSAPPMPMPPVDSFQQETTRVNEWRQVRMPPPGPPRHMAEEESIHPEPPVPMYRNYKPVPNRYSRKYRQPSKPPFFDGLSYSDGC